MTHPIALWGLAGLALCAAEMLLPGVFLLWIGLAAIGASAATALLGFAWHAQIATFVVLALALIALAALRMRARPAHDTVNAPNAGLIGATVTAIDFRAGEGRVHFRDGAWQARLAAGTPPQPGPQPGEIMRIVGLDGTTLLVKTVAKSA